MGYLSTGDVSTLLDAAKAAAKVATDPHLPEVTCHVLRLAKMEKGQNPGPPCPQIPKTASLGKGIGLRHVVGPVRFAVKAREKPVLVGAAAVAVFGGVFLLGFAIGRSRGGNQ